MKSKSGSKNISEPSQNSRKHKKNNNNNGQGNVKTNKNGQQDKNKKGGSATVPTNDFSWEAADSNGIILSSLGSKRQYGGGGDAVTKQQQESSPVSNYVYHQMNSYVPFAQESRQNGTHDSQPQFVPFQQPPKYQKQTSYDEKLDKKTTGGGGGSKILGSLPNIVAHMRRLSIGKNSEKDASGSNKAKRNSMSHSSSSEHFFHPLLSNRLVNQTSYSFSSNDISHAHDRAAYHQIENQISRNENYFRPIVTASQAREVFYEGQAVPLRNRAGNQKLNRDPTKRYSWAVGDRHSEQLRYESDQFRRSFMSHSPINEDTEAEFQQTQVVDSAHAPMAGKQHHQPVNSDQSSQQLRNNYVINNNVQYNVNSGTSAVVSQPQIYYQTAASNPFYPVQVIPQNSSANSNNQMSSHYNFKNNLNAGINHHSQNSAHNLSHCQPGQKQSNGKSVKSKATPQSMFPTDEDFDTDCNELYAMVSTLENGAASGTSEIGQDSDLQAQDIVNTESVSSNQSNSIKSPPLPPKDFVNAATYTRESDVIQQEFGNPRKVVAPSNLGSNQGRNGDVGTQQNNGVQNEGSSNIADAVPVEHSQLTQPNQQRAGGSIDERNRNRWREERAVLVQLCDEKVAAADRRCREMETEYTNAYRRHQEESNSSHQAMTEELSRRETELKAAQNTIRNLSNIISSKDTQMIGLRDQISYLNRELNQKCSLVGQLQQKVIQSQASIDFFKSQHSQLQDDVAKAENERARLKDEVKQLRISAAVSSASGQPNVNPNAKSEHWNDQQPKVSKVYNLTKCECSLTSSEASNSNAGAHQNSNQHHVHQQLTAGGPINNNNQRNPSATASAAARSHAVNKTATGNCELHQNVIPNPPDNIPPHHRVNNNSEVNNNNGNNNTKHVVHNLSEKIAQLEKSLAKMEQDRQQQSNVYERERICWLEEKEIVLRYQKQLQANYTHVDNVNKMLQKQIDKQNQNHF